MKIKFYNTLAHKIENFEPINDKMVKIYTCGPTVYDYQHIGNYSAYLRADILKRIFKYFGYKVKHVINITDVGHLTSDADTGEDKMEKGAKREGKSAKEIARFFEKDFMEQLPKLNILEPDIFSRASEHIKEQVMMVKILEAKGYTYKTSDGIYFDTSKLKNYGELANIKAQKQIAGARVKLSDEKKNPQDFSLWKFEPEGTKRQQVWETPWGKRTFPGWHIECSAMSIKYLGDYFDVHTGGIDHIGVHHTNEIAQNNAATGHKVVNYWIHFEHLLIDNHKMSKSKGGFITIATIEDKGFSPLAFRYLILTSGYRHKLNFTWKSMQTAQNSLNSLYAAMRVIISNKGKVIKKYNDLFKEALANNLDTAKAMALVWNLLKSNEKKADIYQTLLKFDEVLGLDFAKLEKNIIPKEILSLVKDMDAARDEKDWQKADEYRLEIEKQGYKVRNTPQGSVIEKV